MLPEQRMNERPALECAQKNLRYKRQFSFVPLIAAGLLATNDVTIAQPVNNDCGSAIVITGDSGTEAGTTVLATADGTSTCNAGLQPDVWYSYTPSSDGILTLDTCSPATNFDTILSIHSECNGDQNNQLVCNDDSDACGAKSIQSQVQLCVTTGTTYVIRVAAPNAQGTGLFTLNWNMSTVAAPTNVQAVPAVICPQGGSSTISADVNPGETVQWYTGSCGQSFHYEGNPFPIASLTGPNPLTVYARAKNIATGCVSEECATFTYTFADTEAPVISDCGEDVALPPDSTCQAAIPDFASAIVVTDNCTDVGDLVITQTPTAGTIVGPGIHSVTITVQDDIDPPNESQCVRTFTVTDTVPPEITSCSSDQVVAGDANCEAQLQDYTSFVQATDNCGSVTVTQSPIPGTTINGADNPHVVTFTVEDDLNNSDECSINVTVTDSAPPRLLLRVAGPTSCVQENDTIQVELVQLDLCPSAGAGFQAFLQYDPSLLDFQNVQFASDPYGQVILNSVDEGAGTIDIAAGIDQGAIPPQEPSTLDAVLATISFTAIVDSCTSAPALSFRTNKPPTRVTDSDLQPIVEDDKDGPGSVTDSEAVLVDSTAPTIVSLASDLTVECDGSGNATELQSWLSTNAGATADDVCSNVKWSNDFGKKNGLSEGCGETGSVTVTFTASDQCGKSSDTIATFTIEDTTDPSLSVPANAVVECGDSLDPSNPDTNGSATANDSCGNVSVDFTDDNAGLTECSGTGTIDRTWTATDDCGNTNIGVQAITVVDTTPPALTVPSNLTVECDESTDPNDTGIATATDACDSDPLVTHSDAIKPGSCEHEYIIRRTWTVTDACGNSDSQDQLIFVDDTTAPDVTNYPADISVHADAGVCTAFVSWTPPDITDNCDPNPLLVYDIDIDHDFLIDSADQSASSYTFPSGTHQVTAKASDVCGNVNASCQFLVTVSDSNVIQLSIELANVDPGPLNRCIRFEAFDCATESSITVDQVIPFVDGVATNVNVLVPCGAYTCVAANDVLHTLRRAHDQSGGFGISGTTYVADFTGTRSLTGGNLNNDKFIDILDFGGFTSQYAQNFGTGDTDCTTPGPHADLSGDGIVFTEDFTFIQVNFLDQRDDNCCGLAGIANADEPVKTISVDELWDRDLGHLSVADLNDDGILDVNDITAFVNGERPEPLAVFVGSGSVKQPDNWFSELNWSNGFIPDRDTNAVVAGHAEISSFAQAGNVSVMSDGSLRILEGEFAADDVFVAQEALFTIRGNETTLLLNSLHIESGAKFHFGGGSVEVANSLQQDNLDLIIGSNGSPSSLRLLNNATISSGDMIVIGRHGHVYGTGNLAGFVFNTGWLSPEGSIAIDGDYVQDEAGSLAVLLTAGGVDHLSINGRASLNGTLHITLATGLVPAVGAQYEILNATKVISKFSTVNVSNRIPGIALEATYGKNRVVLTVKAVE